MSTHPLSRKVASSAALVVAIGGLPFLAAPAQAVPVPTFATCESTSDLPTQTITLTGDCDTYTALAVPDGWTLDGAGHTVTAVQDAGHPSYTGPVVSSATGDDSSAATMNVENLTITSRGFDQFTQDVLGSPAIGISMIRAGGSLTDVTVDGIAHAAPGQLTRAIFVDNQNSGSNDVPRANVTLDRVTTTRFQKSGVFLRGNLGYVAQHLTVGQSENVDGSRNLQNASNGIVAISGAHGSITDSTVGENRYPADDGGAPADVVSATSILLEDVGRTVLAHNVIEGTDGDTGILVDNYTNNINSVVTISCSTLIRHDGGNADDNVGAGVWNDEGSTPGAVDLTLASNTFSGWKQNVRGDSTETTDPTCSTGTQLSASATHVVYGTAVTLSGVVSNADGSPATGTATLQRREPGETTFTDMGTAPVGADGRFSFRVTPKQRTSYRAKFSGDTFTNSTSKLLTVGVSPRIGVRINDATPKRKGLVVFTGSVAPSQAVTEAILQRFQQGHWVDIQRDTLSSNAFRLTWRAPNTTGKSSFRVQTDATSDFAEGNSRTMVITVVR